MNTIENRYLIRNCRTPDNPVPGQWIEILNGRIVAVGTKDAPPERAGDGGIPVYDAKGGWAVPGFMEMHIHGCGPLSLEREDEEGGILHRTALELETRGINSFLPTLQANEPAVRRLGKELSASEKLRERIPGLYVEGPFVSAEKKGGILQEHISPPDPDDLRRLQETAGGWIKLMTVAPELPGAEALLPVMAELGILPCFGHSGAALSDSERVAAEVRRACGRPAHLTHLFNAMSPISHKEPGLAMLPFTDDDVTFEINGDAVHVHPDTLRFCWKHLDRSRMVLISDAVVSAGYPPGDYSYFGNPVVSGDSGVRYAENGVLIGSRLLIPSIASVFAEIVGATLPEIIPLVANNPRRILRQNSADIIVVDDGFRPVLNFNRYSGARPELGVY